MSPMNDMLLSRERFETVHEVVKSYVDALSAKGYTPESITVGVEIIAVRHGWLLNEFMDEVDLRGVTLYTPVSGAEKKVWN